jgi:uncharacterized protein (UPF0335 family)
MNIQNLVANGNLKGAIQILLDRNIDGAISLMSRFNRLQSDRMSGIISNSDETIERNRIASAIIHYAGSENTFQAPPQYSAPQTLVVGDFNEKALLDIVIQNKRRRPEISNEAQDILNEYRSWKDAKAVTPSFDPVNRRLKSLQAKADELLQRLLDEKEVSLEQIIERISKLLEPITPEYQSLKEAYTLASGRGFKNSWIEQQLLSMPNDDEVRISIAEKIEEFTALIYAQ